jgi:nitrate/nitrite transporter NarK
VAVAAVLSVMTAPGQTAGLSVFTDPLIEQLGITRTDISIAYLVGTLTGAAAQPFFGRALDRWGARKVTAVIAVAFCGALIGVSFAAEIVGLTAGYVGVRMLGQGALSLAATTVVARHAVSRRGLALGISSAIGSAGISLAPIVLDRLLAVTDMRVVWRAEAAVVLVVVLVLAWLLPRDTGDRPHVEATPSAAIRLRDATWTRSQALRTGMFWVVTGAVATSGMLTTGLAFHQIAILGERGLPPWEAAANFLPQTATGLLATLAVGAFIDRANPRLFVMMAMGTLAFALVGVSWVGPGVAAIAYGLTLGAASGALRGLEAATLTRYFGTAHIGSIRGVATGIGLAATALGPIVISVAHDAAGAFATPIAWLALLPFAIGVTSMLAQDPVKPAVE